MGIRVGIDLGTTFCAIARINPQTGKAEIIKNSYDESVTPSVLCFEQNGNILFGEEAKSMQEQGDSNTAAFFKRSMGKTDFVVEFYGKEYTATDLSAILLEKIIAEAEEQCGEAFDAAVITVPAYFADSERKATLTAAKKAGLKDVELVNEPTAAAFAYGINEKDTEQTILIYDLGGGTFDVTIANVTKNEIVVLGSDGNHDLGGKNWDDCIARYLAKEFFKKTDIDLGDADDSGFMGSLIVKAETAKKHLSSRNSVNIPVKYKGFDETFEITTEKFVEISDHLMGTTRDVISSLMRSVNKSWSDIDGAILVGGSTRMKMIHDYIEKMSGSPPLRGINVDEAVALGAAIRANIKRTGEIVKPQLGGSNGKSVLKIAGAKSITDATAHSLGMIAVDEGGTCYINSVIIHRQSAIPINSTKSYKHYVGEDGEDFEIYVTQGDYYDEPLRNRLINKYVIAKKSLTKESAEEVIIDVTYTYTSDSIIEVSAAEQETKKSLAIDIQAIPKDMTWVDNPPVIKQIKRKVIQSASVYLAIDLSGSMFYGVPLPVDKAKEAMLEFVSQMDSSNVKIGLIAFANRVNCTLGLTNDYSAVKRAIQSIDKVSVGGGNSAQPFNEIRSRLSNEKGTRYAIVLTDGEWERTAEAQALSVSKDCHRANIDIMALGFGSANRPFLEKIASIKEYAKLSTVDQLGGSFVGFAQEISGKISAR